MGVITIPIVLAFLKKFWIPIVLTVVIIGGVLIGRSCYINYKQEQARKELNNARQEVINAIIEENLANTNSIREDAINKGSNTNEARENVNAVRNNDSSNSNTNASAVRERFCRAYPTDSLCQ